MWSNGQMFPLLPDLTSAIDLISPYFLECSVSSSPCGIGLLLETLILYSASPSVWADTKVIFRNHLKMYLLRYSWLAMLCYFQMYNIVIKNFYRLYSKVIKYWLYSQCYILYYNLVTYLFYAFYKIVYLNPLHLYFTLPNLSTFW